MRGVPKGNRPVILTYHDIGLNRESVRNTSRGAFCPFWWWREVPAVPGSPDPTCCSSLHPMLLKVSFSSFCSFSLSSSLLSFIPPFFFSPSPLPPFLSPPFSFFLYFFHFCLSPFLSSLTFFNSPLFSSYVSLNSLSFSYFLFFPPLPSSFPPPLVYFTPLFLLLLFFPSFPSLFFSSPSASFSSFPFSSSPFSS